MRRFTPTQMLVLGFGTMIMIGTALLSLPFASADGRSISFLDALFTATSSICVTGLIVKDTPLDFSLFGQLSILALIQIGGLGYMSVATILLVALGKRIGIRERLIIQETLSTFTTEGLIRFLSAIVKFTIVVETIGAVLLATRFSEEMGLGRALYVGVFHSISAFNNAGFSLFSDSLAAYRTDPVVNGVVMVLVIMGGLGFLVYQDVLKLIKREIRTLSIQTKTILVATFCAILAGWVGILVFEGSNPLSLQPLKWYDKGLSSLFQSVSSRTAGFSTLDVSTFSPPTLYMLVLQMFVGGSPGSTGGGIKTTTMAIMILALWATMRGREDVTLFHRRVPPRIISKAFFLAAIAMNLVTGVTLLLLYTEGREFLPTLFEVTSAAATVGMTTGDGMGRSFVALFSDFGKAVILLTMIIGRIGPLAIGITVMTHVRRERYRYPEGKIMIG